MEEINEKFSEEQNSFLFNTQKKTLYTQSKTGFGFVVQNKQMMKTFRLFSRTSVWKHNCVYIHGIE